MNKVINVDDEPIIRICNLKCPTIHELISISVN